MKAPHENIRTSKLVYQHYNIPFSVANLCVFLNMFSFYAMYLSLYTNLHHQWIQKLFASFPTTQDWSAIRRRLRGRE